MVGEAWVCMAEGVGRTRKEGVADTAVWGRLAVAWVCMPDVA